MVGFLVFSGLVPLVVEYAAVRTIDTSFFDDNVAQAMQVFILTALY